MTVTCPEFLDALSNRRCVEEFIKEMDIKTRDQLAEIIELLNTYWDIEAQLLEFFDQYYLIVLNFVNEQIAALAAQNEALLESYETFKSYWLRFRDCPGAALLATYIEDRINLIAGNLKEKITERNKYLKFLDRVGIKNADLLVKKLLIGDSEVIHSIQDFLTGFAQCLEKGIAAINPPFTGTV